MCGIVGLHLRNPGLHPRLGELLAGMLCEMGDRGSDSTGVAVYGDPAWSPVGRGCVSLVDVGVPADDIAGAVGAELGCAVTVSTVDITSLLSSAVDSEALLAAARVAYPDALVAGFGADLAVLKGVGHPARLTDSWGLTTAQGWQGVGHNRMATESAVTASGCHPFAVGPDQCLVHNAGNPNPRWCTRGPDSA